LRSLLAPPRARTRRATALTFTAALLPLELELTAARVVGADGVKWIAWVLSSSVRRHCVFVALPIAPPAVNADANGGPVA
jgi:hypothetical protein